MSQKKMKKLRKYLLKNIQDVLLAVRNEVGNKTENMNSRQVYKICKKMYYDGKLKID